MKLQLSQLTLRGSARMKLLAPDAAAALMALERDTSGLVYTDMWRDPTASLLARRTRRTSQLPGYSAHNFGFAVDLDVKTVLQEKKIRFEDLLHLLKKRGWYCHRRDNDPDKPEAEHFTYFGDAAQKYLIKATQDPLTWQLPAEVRIIELYGKEFDMDTRTVQEKLRKLALYAGPTTAQKDLYTREAILAFQRAWDLAQSGSIDQSFSRCLAFVTADFDIKASPA